MFPVIRPTSAAGTVRSTHSSSKELSLTASSQAIVRPNLTINAFNLSKALQLVTKEKPIREELDEPEDERQLNMACRMKSIDRICEVSKALTDSKTMTMGRPMSAGIWKFKIPSLTHQQRRRSSIDTADPQLGLGSSLRKTLESKPSLARMASDRTLKVAFSTKPIDIASILSAKAMQLHSGGPHPRLQQRPMTSISSKPLRSHKKQSVENPAKLEKQPPFFKATFYDPSSSEFKSQGGLVLEFESPVLTEKPGSTLTRAKTSAVLKRSWRYSQKG
jgi:hypothetical protein